MIRDLGYKTYDGPRRGPSHGTWAIMELGLHRARRSWLLWIAFFGAFLPLLGVAYGIVMRMNGVAVQGGELLTSFLRLETVVFVAIATTGTGATAIAEDLSYRAFPFFFSKPLRPMHYWIGRVLAVAVLIALILGVPGSIAWLALVSTALDESGTADAFLLVPAIASSLVIIAVMSVLSVSISALSRNRALTMSAWVAFLGVPYMLGSIVDGIARANGNPDGWPWLLFGSIFHLLGVVSRAIFDLPDEGRLTFFYALPALIVFCALGAALSIRRISRVEVVS